MASTIPISWMPAARMSRIHVHWSAGTHKANADDRRSYHIMVEGDGNLVRGDKSIKANEPGSRMTPASHTLNANTGAIAVSMCGMKGAREAPFHPGSWPLTQRQWDVMVATVAVLARRYGIAVTPTTVLTHAEVQPNLNIRQNNKWDITRLAFDPSVRGHAAVGDLMRLKIAIELDATEDSAISSGRLLPQDLKPARYLVSGVKPSTLNFRDGPNGTKKGALVESTVVEKLSESGPWWQVRTRGGFVGWVYSSFLKPE